MMQPGKIHWSARKIVFIAVFVLLSIGGYWASKTLSNAAQGYSHIMPILDGCGSASLETRESIKQLYFDGLHHLEEELNGSFADKTGHTLFLVNCGKEFVLFNQPPEGFASFGGQVFLRFDKETGELLDQMWG
ncbi:MAG: hypothetical protein AAGL23_00010 [Pseudomonadota bacterium]